MTRLIVNSKVYIKYISPDYEKNAYVLVIDEKNSIPNNGNSFQKSEVNAD